MRAVLRLLSCICLSLLSASCSGGGDDDITRIAFISSSDRLVVSGMRLDPAAQHIRAATAEGLVGLNASGEVVPALAERWIVTDDGMSYIFRLRNSDWPDGTALTGGNVKASLERNIAQLQGTTLGLDLAIVADIRAMTGRVIEIRLNSPMPQFLQLLAQPELGLRRGSSGTGPMMVEQGPEELVLSVLPPERRGEPEREDWQQAYRQVSVIGLNGRAATASFEAGEVDAVFNGRIDNLPLADTGPLASGTVRLDAVQGLMGIQVRREQGLLSDPVVREAIAMAIDRDSLLQSFNVGGWLPSTTIVPSDLAASPESARAPQWASLPIEQRQQIARRRVSAWRAADNTGLDPTAAIFVPSGPGGDRIFTLLATDLRSIGIRLERSDNLAAADLALIDRLARYASRRWFLNQLNCEVVTGPCAPEADQLVSFAVTERDLAQKQQLLIQAEEALIASYSYIPIGAPIRWSLIRGGIDGFEENRWGIHPLFPLALRPT